MSKILQNALAALEAEDTISVWLGSEDTNVSPDQVTLSGLRSALDRHDAWFETKNLDDLTPEDICELHSKVGCYTVIITAAEIFGCGEDEMVLKFVRTALDRAGFNAIPR